AREAVEAGAVRRRDLAPVPGGQGGEDLLDRLSGVGEGAVGVRVVRGPHARVGAERGVNCAPSSSSSKVAMTWRRNRALGGVVGAWSIWWRRLRHSRSIRVRKYGSQPSPDSAR